MPPPPLAIWQQYHTNCPKNLDHPEPLTTLQRLFEFPFQFFPRGVVRQQQVIKARVARRQALRVGARTRNREPHTAQASDGCAIRPRGKGEQFPFLFRAQGVYDRPEVYN